MHRRRAIDADAGWIHGIARDDLLEQRLALLAAPAPVVSATGAVTARVTMTVR